MVLLGDEARVQYLKLMQEDVYVHGMDVVINWRFLYMDGGYVVTVYDVVDMVVVVVAGSGVIMVACGNGGGERENPILAASIGGALGSQSGCSGEISGG